jgi:hypothetical protein
MKKIILSGLVAGLLMLLAMMATGLAFSAAYPGTSAEYQNAALFRPWDDPLMYYMYIHPFLMGLLLSLVWSRAGHLIKEESRPKKGAIFGLIIWAVFGIPGMLMTLSSFQISFLLVASWTLSLAVQDVLAGLVFAFMD